jgi:toxin ParE1/3/4
LAWDDLREIVNYLREIDPAAAQRVLDKIMEKCRIITQTPGIGRLRPEFEPGLRSVAAGNYVICYREAQAEVQVIRVLHGARNLEAEFE